MKLVLQENSKGRLINYIIVVVFALYGMSQKSYTFDQTTVFERLFIELVGIGQSKTTSIKGSITNFLDHYIFIVDALKENTNLKKKILELDEKIFQISEVEKENGRLKQLLQFSEELNRERIMAQVISWDSSNEYVLRINKGSNHGIHEKLPVITLNGLVGYVYRVTPNYSDVLTILDSNNRVDAIVSRTRSHGILEGSSNDYCVMKYVVRTENVEIGDLIISAGLGNIYPKGIKIGTISSVEKESYGITQDIEVQPTVDFHRLEEVVVLVDSKNIQSQDSEVRKLEEKVNK